MRELFIHVDVDDLWAITECYGLTLTSERDRHHVIRDGLPRLFTLFSELGIRATFFVCGRDVVNQEVKQIFLKALRHGHRIANHSLSHRLDFRALDSASVRKEIVESHRLLQDELATDVVGFRAPGYAWRRDALSVLAECGYLYDSSLMPCPFGWVFRALDARLTKRLSGRRLRKTQYPLLKDAFHSLAPFVVSLAGGHRLVEIPIAASPFLRLPFQASICLQLGQPYFRLQERLFELAGQSPLVFLLHAADVADFSNTPLGQTAQLGYFARPVEHRLAMLTEFLRELLQTRRNFLTEEWVAERSTCL